ncbi:MAG: hypothetical protein A4C66_07605 [Nitrospira sp. HN-bin3]|nr:MAG: hypothetical protein A4C66_07605 [Nitrospira sp. HN-bin3]
MKGPSGRLDGPFRYVRAFGRRFDGMKWRVLQLSVLLLAVTFSSLGGNISAQPPSEHRAVPTPANQSHGSHREQDGGKWEGSAQGVAYSEFNHRLAGLIVLLFGFAELGHALRCQVPVWTRLVLPCALGALGTYLLIWSDHEAWPIGALTFAQTFSGQDLEILQHKFYGVFSSVAAVSEALRRSNWARHPGWAIPLFLLGFFGALLLFVHSHGNHPADHIIELHHAFLGTVGIGAAVSSAMMAWASGISERTMKRWEVAWATCVVVIGLQLLVYFE